MSKLTSREVEIMATTVVRPPGTRSQRNSRASSRSPTPQKKEEQPESQLENTEKSPMGDPQGGLPLPSFGKPTVLGAPPPGLTEVDARPRESQTQASSSRTPADIINPEIIKYVIAELEKRNQEKE